MAALATVQLLALAPLARASLADAWGAPPHRPTAQSKAAVLLTAGGVLQHERQSPIIRRQEEFAIEDGAKATEGILLDVHHAHPAKRPQRNGRKAPHSVLSAEEHGKGVLCAGHLCKTSSLKHDERIEPEKDELLEGNSAVRNVVRLAEYPGNDAATEDEAPAPAPVGVTCGGHRAQNCAACPTTDGSGHTTFDHGSEWCHGDCQYHEGRCYPENIGSGHAGTTAAVPAGHATRSSVPDLLNPAITPVDAETIHSAANAAVEEQDIEKAKKKKNEDSTDDKVKFWLIVIIVLIVILCICAIGSLIALCVFCFAGTPVTEALEKGVDDAPLAEADDAEAEEEEYAEHVES